jgi:hypothetical protein
MKDATDKEKAFLCGFGGVILASQPFFHGEPSNENLLSAEYQINRFNDLIRYFGLGDSISIIDPIEISLSNEKVLNLLRDTAKIISANYSYFVLLAFELGKSAALIFQGRYCGITINEDMLQDFDNQCKKLLIDEQAIAIFLETLEPITFVEAFHKTQISNMRTINTSTYIETNNGVVNINMGEDLASVALQIQSSIDRLQQQGKSPEEAEKEVAQDIATQAQNNPTTKEKLVKWGQSIGTATVTDVVKGAVKLAIRLAGIPIP